MKKPVSTKPAKKKTEAVTVAGDGRPRGSTANMLWGILEATAEPKMVLVIFGYQEHYIFDLLRTLCRIRGHDMTRTNRSDEFQIAPDRILKIKRPSDWDLYFDHGTLKVKGASWPVAIDHYTMSSIRQNWSRYNHL